MGSPEWSRRRHAVTEGLPDGDADSGRPPDPSQAEDAGTTAFCPRASQALRTRISQYAGDLFDESVRVAKRHGSTNVVSVSDVERASEHLGVRPRGRRAQVIGSIGSTLFGAALGNTLQIAGASQVSSENALLTFAVGTIGVAMAIFGFVRD